MTQPLRILLADDHVLFRKGIASLMAPHQDMQVVGEARDGLEAIEQARLTKPDVVLMDIHMPRFSGLEAIPHILRECPNTRIVMLTVSDDDQDLFTAIKSGAFGYLLKDIDPHRLYEMLEGVRQDEAPIAGVLATKILKELKHYAKSASTPAETPSELTAREVEVLQLVASGETNREIATKLSITENTVKMHLRNILDKLHLQNRIQATAYAVRQGLDKPSNSE
ncbi:MAG: response regulator transcription factor [Chloroflexi bacterium]|nr:response regulator transcription factor [Chloroflexota bacterium]